MDPDTHSENLERVRSAMQGCIMHFCAVRLQSGGVFRADELRRYVNTQLPADVAPGSADRILRDLRQRGLLDYTVESRRQSLYRVMFVREGGDYIMR